MLYTKAYRASSYEIDNLSIGFASRGNDNLMYAITFPLEYSMGVGDIKILSEASKEGDTTVHIIYSPLQQVWFFFRRHF